MTVTAIHDYEGNPRLKAMHDRKTRVGLCR